MVWGSFRRSHKQKARMDDAQEKDTTKRGRKNSSRKRGRMSKNDGNFPKKEENEIPMLLVEEETETSAFSLQKLGINESERAETFEMLLEDIIKTAQQQSGSRRTLSSFPSLASVGKASSILSLPIVQEGQDQ